MFHSRPVASLRVSVGFSSEEGDVVIKREADVLTIFQRESLIAKVVSKHVSPWLFNDLSLVSIITFYFINIILIAPVVISTFSI